MTFAERAEAIRGLFLEAAKIVVNGPHAKAKQPRDPGNAIWALVTAIHHLDGTIAMAMDALLDQIGYEELVGLEDPEKDSEEIH